MDIVDNVNNILMIVNIAMQELSQYAPFLHPLAPLMLANSAACQRFNIQGITLHEPIRNLCSFQQLRRLHAPPNSHSGVATHSCHSDMRKWGQGKQTKSAACRLIGVDLWTFKQRVDHIGQHVQLPQAPHMGPKASCLPEHERPLPFLIINIQLPMKPVHSPVHDTSLYANV